MRGIEAPRKEGSEEGGAEGDKGQEHRRRAGLFSRFLSPLSYSYLLHLLHLLYPLNLLYLLYLLYLPTSTYLYLPTSTYFYLPTYLPTYFYLLLPTLHTYLPYEP